MRLFSLICVAAAIAVAGCGGDDEDKGAGAKTTPATAETTATTSTAADPAPKFPPNKAFSGDEFMKCAETNGLSAEREENPPKDDKVGAGIVHDRVLVGEGGGEPFARVFMFVGDDPAQEQAPLVKKRSPEAESVGTVIFEPLTGEAARVRGPVFECFEQQLSG